MAKERIIWSNLNVEYDDWKDDFHDYLDANGLDEDEVDFYEWVDETLSYYLDDERLNLNESVDGCIVAFASLGLWNGRVNGAKVVGDNVKNILRCNGDYTKWYCDTYNVRCVDVHHDGRNYYLYRVAKNREQAEKLVDKIAYGGMTEEQFRKATRSLRPYVAKVYGF
jgi:hypothetical protein